MRVFISHAASDKKAANRIRTALTQKGFEVWDPDTHLLPGSNWLVETGRALENADAVVFLLSKDSSHSPFARREIEYVIGQSKYEDRVFPVRLTKSIENFPWILGNLSVIDASDEDPEWAAHRIALRLTRKPAIKKGSKRRAPRRAARRAG